MTLKFVSLTFSRVWTLYLQDRIHRACLPGRSLATLHHSASRSSWGSSSKLISGGAVPEIVNALDKLLSGVHRTALTKPDTAALLARNLTGVCLFSQGRAHPLSSFAEKIRMIVTSSKIRAAQRRPDCRGHGEMNNLIQRPHCHSIMITRHESTQNLCTPYLLSS